MARTNTLANYITDVCAAVKEKAGITGKVNASEIDNIIRNLQIGGGLEPNIFIQEEEPETKEGLWIKSADIQVDNTVIDENLFVEDTWRDYTQIPKLVAGTATRGMSTATVGKYLYVGGYGAANTSMYKIDLDTYEVFDLGKPKDATFSFYGKQAIVYNSEIYYLGNKTSSLHNHRYQLFKYNPTTNTYTALASHNHYPFSYTQIVLCGDYIYMFGVASGSAEQSTQATKIMKYSIIDDVWTELSIAYPWYPNYCTDPIVLGTDIWFLFCATINTTALNNYKNVMVFDTKTEQFINANLSFSASLNDGTNTGLQVRCIRVGDLVYVFSKDYIYKLPISELYVRDTAVTLKPADYLIDADMTGIDNGNSMQYMYLSCDADNIYLSGFYNVNDCDIQRLAIHSKEYANNTLVIRQGIDKYSAVLTQLFNIPLKSGRLTYPIADTVHYTTENGINTLLPLYYGDGTQWIKFKN